TAGDLSGPSLSVCVSPADSPVSTPKAVPRAVHSTDLLDEEILKKLIDTIRGSPLLISLVFKKLYSKHGLGSQSWYRKRASCLLIQHCLRSLPETRPRVVDAVPRLAQSCTPAVVVSRSACAHRMAVAECLREWLAMSTRGKTKSRQATQVEMACRLGLAHKALAQTVEDDKVREASAARLRERDRDDRLRERERVRRELKRTIEQSTPLLKGCKSAST
ncbi:hypothetical protein KIPB_010277, partial [Kipferlia bialata]